MSAPAGRLSGGGGVSLAIAVSAALVCGSARSATTFEWSSTSGGDLADGANWNQSGTAPGGSTDDAISIRKDQSAPITLSQDIDLSVQYNHAFAFNGELAFDTLATTLTLGRVYFRGSNKTTTFTRGTLNIPTFALEDNVSGCHDNTFVVDGPDARYVGGSILVGSKNRDNAFVAQNGAIVTLSGFSVGRDAILNGDGTVASNNVFRATGAGTKLTATGTVSTGVRYGNWIEILDGAEAALTDVKLGQWNYDNAAPAVPHLYDGNRGFRIAGQGTKVVVDGNNGDWSRRLTVGWQSGSNTLEVADGAELLCKTNMFIIGNYLSTVEGTAQVVERIPDYRFEGNLVRVTGEGSKVTLDSEKSQMGFFMARGGCDNQRLEILDGGSWESRGEFWIVSGASNGVYVGENARFVHSGYTVQIGVGGDSTNAYFTVDGGTYAPTVDTVIGGSGSYGRFDVVNGGLFAMTNGNLKIGVSGSHNALTVGAGGRLATSNVVLNVTSGASEGNVFAVRDGGKASFFLGDDWSSRVWHHVSSVGTAKGGTILVSGEGSELDMSQDRLVAAISSGGAGARLVVEDGGTLRVANVYWGDQGSDTNDCTIAVSNGTIAVSGGLNVGGSDDTIPHGCSLSIAGSRPSITGGSVGVNRDSVIAFDVPRDGYEDVPIRVKSFTFGSRCAVRPTLRVTMSPRNRAGRVVLVEAENDISVPDDLQLDLPEGARLVRAGEAGYNAKQLKVRLPRDSGLIMIVR